VRGSIGFNERDKVFVADDQPALTRGPRDADGGRAVAENRADRVRPVDMVVAESLGGHDHAVRRRAQR